MFYQDEENTYIISENLVGAYNVSKDSNGIETFAIASPTIELYVKSYNAVGKLVDPIQQMENPKKGTYGYKLNNSLTVCSIENSKDVRNKRCIIKNENLVFNIGFFNLHKLEIIICKILHIQPQFSQNL